MNIKKKVPYNKVAHQQGLVDFLQAWDMDDLPDGAWQAMLEEGAEAYSDEFGISIDPHDAFIEYCTATASF